jgi:hypothetical protein
MPARAPSGVSASHSSQSGTTWEANQSRTSSGGCAGGGIDAPADARARSQRSAAARASAAVPRRIAMSMRPACQSARSEASGRWQIRRTRAARIATMCPCTPRP